MLPLKYPATIMDILNKKQATKESTRGIVGLLTCVLVAFVFVFVSVDVLLGVFDTGKPTSF